MPTTGRRGWEDYAAVLAAIVAGPHTTGEIAARFSMSPKSMRAIVGSFNDAGLVLVVAWRACVPSNRGQRLQPVWGVNGPPAPRPASLPVSTRRAASPAHLVTFSAMVGQLMLSSITPAGLATAFRATLDRVRPLLRRMAARPSLLYVAEWRSSASGQPTPAYAWGPGRKSDRRPRRWNAPDGWRQRQQKRQQKLFWVHMIFLTAGLPAQPANPPTNPKGKPHVI